MTDREVEEFKRALLRDEAALSQVEAAAIIGCRPRDLHEFLKPSFYRNGRPKYVAADVLAKRDRDREAVTEKRDRNTKLVRSATV